MLVLGFMIATTFLSMWVSNTATAMMMMPIGLAVVSEVTGLTPSELRLGGGAAGSDLNIGRSLTLAIAYSASVGGITTIIGTPPNAILVGTVNRLFDYQITFLDWMLIGMPLAIVTLAFVWVLLTQVLFPATSFSRGNVVGVIDEKLAQLGPWSKEEMAVAFTGICMGTMWIMRGFLFKYVPALAMVNDSTIAIAGALMLFCWPRNLKKSEFLLDWKTAVNIPWNVVLLFGGGLALANGFQHTEVTHYVGRHLMNLEGIHVYIVLTMVVLLAGTLTEITSNTATATLVVPIMAAVSLAMNINPIGPMMAAALVCSYCFMLPVATPPNAIAYSTGCFTIKDMAKAGITINIASILLIPIVVYFMIPFFWGENLHVVPQWALNAVLP
jgi:sodium-dependent dicarboxylate transporter 2/3/5